MASNVFIHLKGASDQRTGEPLIHITRTLQRVYLSGSTHAEMFEPKTLLTEISFYYVDSPFNYALGIYSYLFFTKSLFPI
jgi:hypothetical protein